MDGDVAVVVTISRTSTGKSLVLVGHQRGLRYRHGAGHLKTDSGPDVGQAAGDAWSGG
ncbi:hypothetical protein [Aeromicrobium sp. Sec7.5]|uniref:hypothetical protein n=1 Tax=Aeromicrobium sp. Sec7.5 TaxID=3121276 RepID=UPI002FE444E5